MYKKTSCNNQIKFITEEDDLTKYKKLKLFKKVQKQKLFTKFINNAKSGAKVINI
jgi:hypothetical protein